jgi:hypothetical protein
MMDFIKFLESVEIGSSTNLLGLSLFVGFIAFIIVLIRLYPRLEGSVKKDESKGTSYSLIGGIKLIILGIIEIILFIFILHAACTVTGMYFGE